ncbi:mRNA-decapping enzyme 1B isoform X2 [Ochotona princeps]|uniref:mRNA-decapping enzyme 1B isoform X2 n=1 Tax=Ochotona princeps TaxID=9978 RepID=UPI002714D8A4|nr:mRNA-decapping enzyme 1B isoform X2 [Ochotona princeps]
MPGIRGPESRGRKASPDRWSPRGFRWEAAARSFCAPLRVASGHPVLILGREGRWRPWRLAACWRRGATSAWRPCSAMTPISTASWTWPARWPCTPSAIGPTSGRRLTWKEPCLFIQVSIYGIWFYDKEECQRIAELMKNLAQHEQLKACQGTGAGASPVLLSAGDGKEVDILRMLTKAKDEYTKCKTCSEPKQITSSSAIYDNPNLIKPIPVKPSEHQQQRIPQPSQNLDPEPQHLSLTALFGKQDRAPSSETAEQTQTPQAQHKKLPGKPGVARSLSYEGPKRHSPTMEKQLCPAIQKLMVRGADLHPWAELPESRPCQEGSPHLAVPPGSLRDPGAPPNPQSASRTQSLLEKLHSAPGAADKCDLGPTAPAPTPTPAGSVAPGCSRTLTAAAESMAQPQLDHVNGTLAPPTPGPPAHGKERAMLPGPTQPPRSIPASSPQVVAPQELLRKLRAMQQEQQLPVSTRPALAAKFPAAAQGPQTGKPLESWINKTSASGEKQAPFFQVASPPHSPATAPPALLLAPTVFTHCTSTPPKERDSRFLALGGPDPPATSSSLLVPLQNPEPPVSSSNPLTKLQLQEALLYLIQNDDNFLNIIYEAYLFSMTQAAMKKAA